MGQFQHGKQHGRGKFEGADGEEYEGEWAVGQRSGQGWLSRADGERYEGGLKADNYEGRGRHVSRDGSHFDGYFTRGLEHGHCRPADVGFMVSDECVIPQNDAAPARDDVWFPACEPVVEPIKGVGRERASFGNSGQEPKDFPERWI